MGLDDELGAALRRHQRQMLADQHPGLAAGWIFPIRKRRLHRGTPLNKVLRQQTLADDDIRAAAAKVAAVIRRTGQSAGQPAAQRAKRSSR